MAYETYQLKKMDLLQSAGLSSSSLPTEEQAQDKRLKLDEVERAAREYIRDRVFGGRLLFAIVGTAPSSAAVSALIQQACEMPMVEGYGSTELGGITIENRINVATVVKWKLIDVPELGYTLKDQPCPRGELLVLTTTGIPGYYKHPKATAELIDTEGFFHTGDIMEQRGPEELVWIDRRKNVLKLAQGEYLSISRLEALYAGDPDVKNIFLYGNSLRSYVLAVVVPSEALVAAAKAGLEGGNGGNGQKGSARDELAGQGEVEEEAVLARLKPLLRQRLDSMAKEAGLASYEVPRDFIVQLAGFTRENKLVTDSNKLARARLKETFGPRLEAMYDAVEQRKERRLEHLHSDPQASTTDMVRAVLEMTLGLGEEVGLDATFAQLGGDSLSAVRVTEHLQRLCGVGVPVAELLNPAMTLSSLIQHLDLKLKRGQVMGAEDVEETTGEEEIYRCVHGLGDDASVIFAQDLTIGKFIPTAVLHPPEAKVATDWAAGAEKGFEKGEGRVRGILLTGANGFLGRFLLLELLQKLCSQTDYKLGGTGRVYCLIRGRDEVAAKRRLWEAVGASLLQAHEDRIVVLAGDVSRPHLGLSGDTYAKLLENVDLVLHAGALVNHNLSYRSLFGPNVVGTANIIKFCLARPSHPKPLHYVSTIAVTMGEGGPGRQVHEGHLGYCWGKQRFVKKGTYAEGYGASKWAAEVLLQNVHKETGLPVVAYRCSMILPHSSLPGQINVADVFTRLLAGVIYTGVAPASFTDGHGPAPAYDGSPVDFVAGAIVAIVWKGFHRSTGQVDMDAGQEIEASGCRLFHVINPHVQKGPSLDDMIDWVQSAGYDVERITPYRTWLETFESKLQALPSEKRNQSPLPVLKHWQDPSPSRIHAEEISVVDASRFRAAVKELTRWGDVPCLSEGYLLTCLYQMSKVGLISATPAVMLAKLAEK
jgi:fatty acid CoA ligase FadD9